MRRVMGREMNVAAYGLYESQPAVHEISARARLDTHSSGSSSTRRWHSARVC